MRDAAREQALTFGVQFSSYPMSLGEFWVREWLSAKINFFPLEQQARTHEESFSESSLLSLNAKQICELKTGLYVVVGDSPSDTSKGSVTCGLLSVRSQSCTATHSLSKHLNRDTKSKERRLLFTDYRYSHISLYYCGKMTSPHLKAVIFDVRIFYIRELSLTPIM